MPARLLRVRHRGRAPVGATSRASASTTQRLDELAASITNQGIIQPLVVRKRGDGEGGGYELIAGERRWRAAQRAGLQEVPVVVKDVQRARGLRAGAGREPAARGPEPDRGGRGLPAAGRRVRLHAGAAGGARGQGPRDGGQRAAPAASCRRRCATSSPSGELPMGHARALLGPRRRRGDRAGRRPGGAEAAVGAPGRGAGAARARRRQGQEARGGDAAVDGVDARPRAEAGARVRHPGAPGAEDDPGRQDRDRLPLARSARLDPR